MSTVAPYGSWRSPITPAMVGGAGVGLNAPQPAGDGGVLWLESRPLEGGRSVLVRRTPGGEAVDVTPPGYNLRTRVHEYGGIPFAVHGDQVFFSNYSDQRLHRQPLDGGEPVPITPEPPTPASHRFADLSFTADGRHIVAVRERHEPDGVINEIVILPADGSEDPRILVEGNDFYAFPRVSPDGERMAWTTWNHPNMPWDSVGLWVADFSPSGLGPARQVAGGQDESIFQPEWSPQGVLDFVSDRGSGWWNLWRERDGQLENLTPIEAEFGTPQWLLGTSTYAFLDERRSATIFVREGRSFLAILDTEEGSLHDFDLPFNTLGAWIRAEGDEALPDRRERDGPARRGGARCRDRNPGGAQAGVRARARPRTTCRSPFDRVSNRGRTSTAHALFYPPANRISRTDGERPPLHRRQPRRADRSDTRPAQARRPVLDQPRLRRGRRQLRRQHRLRPRLPRAAERPTGASSTSTTASTPPATWPSRARSTAQRLAIRGGSAGGYTTLCALDVPRRLRAPARATTASADLRGAGHATPTSSSRATSTAWSARTRSARDVYRERSPIHHTDRLSMPGDPVPGAGGQGRATGAGRGHGRRARAKGLPFAYLPFEGEQHGFRKAENIQRTLEAELYFYCAGLRVPARRRDRTGRDREPLARLPRLRPAGIEEPSRRAGMGVPVLGIRRRSTSIQKPCGYRAAATSDSLAKERLFDVAIGEAVSSPHDHRGGAHHAVRHPTFGVLEVPRRDALSRAEQALVALLQIHRFHSDAPVPIGAGLRARSAAAMIETT